MDKRRFKLIYIGPTGSDCTAPYDVKLETELTVGEFVHDVLLNDEEWGYIYVMCKPNKMFYNPSCEYRDGKLLSKLPGEIMDRNITKVIAHGGWSNMDYRIYV